MMDLLECVSIRLVSLYGSVESFGCQRFFRKRRGESSRSSSISSKVSKVFKSRLKLSKVFKVMQELYLGRGLMS